MAIITSAGPTLSISSAAPATFDKAGYEALTFTEIGKVTDLGEIPSRVYELVTLQPIATRGTEKGKGGFAEGSQTITLALTPDDAGQILAESAVDDDEPVAVEIAHPQLGTFYAQALVMSFTRSLGDVNSAATGSLTLEYTTSDGGVGMIAVPVE